MLPEHLTPEQQEKLQKAQSPEDILALAREEGYELDDGELENIAGGAGWGGNPSCPECGGSSVWDGQLSVFICRSCGHEFA